MTFFVKCDTCGKVQEADDNGNYPLNPINPETGEKWYSRLHDGKTQHACSEECIKEGPVWPKWAK